jgi:hypothetical protein
LYQWFDCVPSTLVGQQCSPVSGATSSGYMLASSDVGDTVEVRVTATNSSGSSAAASIQTGMIGPSGVRTFYISYTHGSDSNSGTLTSAPWKDAPGMQQCSGNCASYSAQAGDRFIFEGGDSWPNSEFPLASHAGVSGKPDYYGAETDWYVGSSFSQPTFSGGGADICPSSCRDPNAPGGTGGIDDVLIDASGQDYVELDDLHLTDFSALTAQPYHQCAELLLENNGGSEDDHITVNRLTMDNISIGAWAQGYGSTSGDNSTCDPILFSPQSPFSGSSVIENSTITGDGDTYGRVMQSVPNAINNTISGFPEGFIYPAGSGTIAGNNLSYCSVNPSTGQAQGPTTGGAPASAIHSNAIEDLGVSGSDTFYIHDNVVHNTGAGSGFECESLDTGYSGEVDYVWNNVFYDLGGNSIHVDQGQDPTGYYAWNNSLEGGFNTTPGSMDTTQSCFLNAHGGSTTTVYIQNNFCVTNASSAVASSIAGSSNLVTTPNVLVTPFQVRSGTYKGDFALPDGSNPAVWEPLSNSTPVAGAGTNLASDCTGSLTGLCSDTTYAGARTTISRPSGGMAWSVGAYQAP